MTFQDSLNQFLKSNRLGRSIEEAAAFELGWNAATESNESLIKILESYKALLKLLAANRGLVYHIDDALSSIEQVSEVLVSVRQRVPNGARVIRADAAPAP